MTTGITLAQLAALETEPLRKGIFMNILRDAQILETLPFQNVSSLRTIAVRWSKLPTGGAWRKLNEGYTASQEGEVEQVEETLFGFGGEITYDRVLDKITNMIEDPVALQTKMKIKALAYNWKDIFINGDHASDEDSFEGLKKRIANLPTRQTVYAAASNAAGLDATASTTTARAFYDKFEYAYHYCNGGQVDAMYCNEDFILGFAKVARYLQIASGGAWLDTTQDSLGRQIITWKGKPFYDMGYKSDQSTEIITKTEAGGDSSANTTSVYFASFNNEQGIVGIQLGPMEVYDPFSGGESPTLPAKLRRIDWWNGLAMFGSYGLVRLRNIKDPTLWT